MLALILNKRNWAFTKEETGEHLTGTTLQYLDPDAVSVDGDRRGYDVFSLPATADGGRAFDHVPGVYELDVKPRPDKRGRPVLTVTGGKFLRDANIAEILNPSTKKA